MPLLVNLRHLEADNVHLKGSLSGEELDIDSRDDMVRAEENLDYDLEVQHVEDGLLVQGKLSMPLACQCVRCLKPFAYRLAIANWTRLLPLTGEEAVPVVSDFVDLTPCLREDILLEFPQHPLCEPECRGLPKAYLGTSRSTSSTSRSAAGPSAWDELNKLKF